MSTDIAEIVREDIRRRVEQVFRQVVEDFGPELVELALAKEHVRVFTNSSPRGSIAR